MTFNRGGNFNGAGRISGRSMRDRENHNDHRIIRSPLDREHDHAGAILALFFPSRFVFVVPQIGIGNDKARFERGAFIIFGSSTASRCACRSSMREEPMA
jgi:hypothetical protein